MNVQDCQAITTSRYSTMSGDYRLFSFSIQCSSIRMLELKFQDIEIYPNVVFRIRIMRDVLNTDERFGTSRLRKQK